MSSLASASIRMPSAQRRPARVSNPLNVRCSRTKAALIGAAAGFGVGAVVGARGNGLPGPWIDGIVGAPIGALAGLLLCGG